MTFSEKTVLVTGGTSGIGLAIAKEFELLGASVIARGLPELDVASQEDVNALIGGLDRLDILVNCAGMIARDDEFEMPVFLRVLDVNLAGSMRLCLACKPLLARANGCIVNVASILSFFGGPRVPAYSASKGGVAQLTKSLAVAWAADGIRERGSSRMDCDLVHASLAGRFRKIRRDSGANSHGALGKARRDRAGSDILVFARSLFRHRGRYPGGRRLFGCVTASQL